MCERAGVRVHGRHPAHAGGGGDARTHLQRVGQADRQGPERVARGLPGHPGPADQPLVAHLPRGDDPDGHLRHRHDELDRARTEDPHLLRRRSPAQRGALDALLLYLRSRS